MAYKIRADWPRIHRLPPPIAPRNRVREARAPEPFSGEIHCADGTYPVTGCFRWFRTGGDSWDLAGHLIAPVSAAAGLKDRGPLPCQLDFDGGMSIMVDVGRILPDLDGRDSVGFEFQSRCPPAGRA